MLVTHEGVVLYFLSDDPHVVLELATFFCGRLKNDEFAIDQEKNGSKTNILSWIPMLKLIFWQQFELGLAPLVVGMFFFGSVQLFFIGILGEYIGAIHTQVLKRPHVVELERINF